MKHLTIKARITLLCTLLTAAVAALALGVMIHNEQRVTYGYFRDTLASTAQLAQDEVRCENGRLEIDRNLDDLPNVRISLYNLDGDLLYGQRRVDAAFQPGEVRELRGEDGVRWMTQDSLMQVDGYGKIYLRCSMSGDALLSVRGIRRELMLVLLPALILLAGLGGWLIARRAFAPLARINRTAEGIADGSDLKKRIALRGARDEIYRTAEVFDDMLDRLDAAFDRERRFTSDASHELRTPVAAIMAQSEFALSEAANEADRQAALREIQRRSSHMAALIQRLLALSRLDARQGLEQREMVDLSLLAEITAEALAESAAQKQMSITAEVCGDALVLGDETMLTQAVLNLAENAVRYGKAGGGVLIEVAKAGGECLLRVMDDGPGIAPEHQKRIFDRFYQASPDRSDRGFGLGLSLVKRIVELHGGRLDLQSTPGQGSCFEIALKAVEHRAGEGIEGK